MGRKMENSLKKMALLVAVVGLSLPALAQRRDDRKPPDRHDKGKIVGGIIGAIGGAVIGGEIGGDEGAVIGAIGGAVVGSELGDNRDDCIDRYGHRYCEGRRGGHDRYDRRRGRDHRRPVIVRPRRYPRQMAYYFCDYAPMHMERQGVVYTIYREGRRGRVEMYGRYQYGPWGQRQCEYDADYLNRYGH